MIEFKPLRLPAPRIFSPAPRYTTLEAAHPLYDLPPTPPPPPYVEGKDPGAPLEPAPRPAAAAAASAPPGPARPLSQDEQRRLYEEAFRAGAVAENASESASSSSSTLAGDNNTSRPQFAGKPGVFYGAPLPESKFEAARQAAAAVAPIDTPIPGVGRLAFQYADEQAWPIEVDDFYDLHDRALVAQCRHDFLECFHDGDEERATATWWDVSAATRSDVIVELMDLLERQDQDEQDRAVRGLLYVAQGCYALYDDRVDALMDQMQTNAALLLENNVLPAVSTYLQVAADQLRTHLEAAPPVSTAATSPDPSLDRGAASATVTAAATPPSGDRDLHRHRPMSPDGTTDTDTSTITTTTSATDDDDDGDGTGGAERAAAAEQAAAEHAVYHAVKEHMMERITVALGVLFHLLLDLVRTNACEAMPLSDDLVAVSPLVAVLFHLLGHLSDGYKRSSPLKKLLMVIWKALLAITGGTPRLTRLKRTSRALAGLGDLPPGEALYVKASPADYQYFASMILIRYPAVILPTLGELLRRSDPFFAQFDLITVSGMGGSHGDSQGSGGDGAHGAAGGSHADHAAALVPVAPLGDAHVTAAIQRSLSTLAQEVGEPVHATPEFIQDALRIYTESIYVSLGRVQLFESRRAQQHQAAAAAIDGRPVSSAAAAAASASPAAPAHAMLHDALPSPDDADATPETNTLWLMDDLWARLLDGWPSHIGLLVRWLYYINLGTALQPPPEPTAPSSGPASGSSRETSSGEGGSVSDEQAAALLEAYEIKRHRQIVTRVIATISMLLLKMAKRMHVLRFEYLCQLLIDNNGAILLLKMLSIWFQPLNSKSSGGPTTAPSQPDDVYQKDKEILFRQPPLPQSQFTFYCRRPPYDRLDLDVARAQAQADGSHSPLVSPSASSPPAASSKAPAVDFNNICTMIHLLQILQKLTKGKCHRILALVQWKCTTVLKRILRVDQPSVQIYALKLLKSQTPYLGRKWRMNSMRAITGIYIHLRPLLVDRYLSGDAQAVAELALREEQALRAVTAHYHDTLRAYLEEERGLERAAATAPPDRTTPGMVDPGSDLETALNAGDHDDLLALLPDSPSLERPRPRPRRPSFHAASPRDAGQPSASSPTSFASSVSSSSLHHPSMADAMSTAAAFKTNKAWVNELDEHFQENYETWLQQEVFADSGLGDTFQADHVVDAPWLGAALGHPPAGGAEAAAVAHPADDDTDSMRSWDGIMADELNWYAAQNRPDTGHEREVLDPDGADAASELIPAETV
ncbi:hypothetical protein CXG81DRAFT_23380 [Caulochytrium protostelioides]|uniref:N1221-domain-containing protein n=1 Tax=Caulochytrium protostelioides TaxID=1555241 RepID=A0A4P9XEJ0_9FUNG|nr:hypothetical protein CXG81DRAFT_23380 [Caulochytrium protostelioides]|eukprot:RKP03967.1 hypothetical protein CXG81DRAFT_23380 [Caulochytrium protostelioides]